MLFTLMAPVMVFAAAPTADGVVPVTLTTNTTAEDNALAENDIVTLKFSEAIENSAGEAVTAITNALAGIAFETNVTVAASAGLNTDSQEFTLTVDAGKTVDLTGGVTISLVAGSVSDTSAVVSNTQIDFTVSDADVTSPTVTAAVQAATNAGGQTVNVQSNEGTGSVYIILDGETQVTVADFGTAVAANKGATAAVVAADTDVAVSTAGLDAGTYYAYAVDAAGNISTKGTNAITVTAADVTPPTVTFNPANAAVDVAIDGNITITFNEAVRKLDDSVLADGDLAAMLTLKETNAVGADVAFTATVNAEKTVITIDPNANLANSQAYYVAIAAQVEDAANNAISAANATFTTAAPADITAASITITAPVLGADPQDAAAVEAATANVDYTVTGLTWNEVLTAGGKFKAAQVYTATVTLTSKNGKKFQAAAFTPTVNGSASVGTTTTAGGDVVGNTVSFTVTYAETGALAVTGIAVTTQPTKMTYTETTDDVLALNGMEVTETNNDGSTNVVTFADGTAVGYTASPANGATLDNATHNGNPVVITRTDGGLTANTGNLTVNIAAPADITAASVTITAPVLGADPQDAAAVEAATANVDYTVTGLTWNEVLTAGGKFKAAQVYTATVTLTSKNGKKFQAAAFTPTVNGSASVGTTTTAGGDVVGNTVSFTVTYAETGALAVTGIAVTTQPTKMTYTETTDDVLALNGMEVTETNNDGSTNVVTFADGTAVGYTASPANGATLDNATHNGNPVVITRTDGGLTANTGNLTVNTTPTYALTLTGDNITSTPAAGNLTAGTSVTVTVAPAAGKQVATFTVGGADQKAALAGGTPNQYTFNITADTEVVVTYENIPGHVINITANNTLLVGRHAFNLEQATQDGLAAGKKYTLNNYLTAVDNWIYKQPPGTYHVYYYTGSAWYDLVADPDLETSITNLNTINGDGLYEFINMTAL